MRKALVIGIDDYSPPNSLNGCVNDAVELSALLARNGDGSPNFDVRRITSNDSTVSTRVLIEAIKELFSGDAEMALFYFAGHGIVDDQTNDGFIVSQDGQYPSWGVGMSVLLNLANQAYPNIRSTVVLLDSCQSGFAGEVSGLGTSQGVSHIGTGVTILAACHRRGAAAEQNGHGKFTDILMDGMGGSASDVVGHITPASLYAHIDQTLGAWEQRPIYKANVQNFVSLRKVAPKVSGEILRRLPTYFPSPSDEFQLDPSFEPDRGEEAQRLSHIEVNEANVRIYRDLQKCNRFGLIVPTNHEHMWHAAVFSGCCRLTALGSHYRRLAEKNKL